jgi:hypothetical protein
MIIKFISLIFHVPSSSIAPIVIRHVSFNVLLMQTPFEKGLLQKAYFLTAAEYYQIYAELDVVGTAPPRIHRLPQGTALKALPYSNPRFSATPRPVPALADGSTSQQLAEFE